MNSIPNELEPRNETDAATRKRAASEPWPRRRPLAGRDERGGVDRLKHRELATGNPLPAAPARVRPWPCPSPRLLHDLTLR